MTTNSTLQPEHSLRRGSVGVAAIVFFVISAAAPLTAVAGGVPMAMLLGNGAGVPAAYVLTMLVILLFSVGYTAMARHINNSGAFYAFTTQGLGGLAGGAAAITALLAYNTMQAGIYGMFGVVVSTALQNFVGLDVPWWASAAGGALIISVLGYRNVDLSAKLLGVLVAGEFFVTLIFDIAVVLKGGDSGLNLVSFQPATVGSGSLPVASLFCFASFIGFEATSIYSEEAHDPKRTIPLATFLAVLIIGVFYTFTTWCMAVGGGVDKLGDTLKALQDPTTFLFGLSDRYVGGLETQAMNLLFISSLFAALLAFHNAVARYFFSLGRERLLPGFLGRTHDIHQSPHLGSVVQSLTALAFIAVFAICQLDPILAMFAWLTNVGSVAVMALMALVSFAVIAFFRKRPGHGESWLTTLLLPTVSGVAMVVLTGMAMANFNVLTGDESSFAVLLPASVGVAAVIGVAIAWKLKTIAPHFYAALGSHRD